MYCLPLDDSCQLARLEQKLIVAPAEDFLVDARTFDLGTFNGRTYTYTWIGSKPAIFINKVGALPSAIPDILGD